jgi:hypothetical protein
MVQAGKKVKNVAQFGNSGSFQKYLSNDML